MREGDIKLFGSNPSGTSLSELVSVPSTSYLKIKYIIVSSSGSGANATITWNNGSTNFYILRACPIEANETKVFSFVDGLEIPSGYSIYVQDSVGNQLSFTVAGNLIPIRG